MEGDVAPSVYVKELRAHRFERFAAHEQVLGVAAFAERVHRRMLHQQDRARLFRGRRCALRRCRPVRFSGCQGVEQGLLQIPAGFVVHLSEVPAVNVHRCKLLTLFRASSAKYDERTSGALAQ